MPNAPASESREINPLSASGLAVAGSSRATPLSELCVFCAIVDSWRTFESAATWSLLPEVPVPCGSHAIVNGHFRLACPARLPGGAQLLGLVGGTAEWLFLRDELVSLTVSAADDLAEEPSATIAARLWADTARALGLPAAPQPPGRIVKERRATFAQTPAAVARRPGATTAWSNLFLAGDWTATGLPATIEGAVRSGQRAADLALAGVTAGPSGLRPDSFTDR